jgi:hypothetical protein
MASENEFRQLRSRAGESATVPDEARLILRQRLYLASTAPQARMGARVLSLAALVLMAGASLSTTRVTLLARSGRTGPTRPAGRSSLRILPLAE